MTARLVYALDGGADPRFAIDCPLAGGHAARVDRHGDRVSIRCMAACDDGDVRRAFAPLHDAVLAELSSSSRVTAAEAVGRTLASTPASSIRPTRVRWALRGRVPLGHVTLLAGAPKLGKSQWSTLLGAQVTVGAAEGDLHGQPADAVVLSYEDHPGATIVPRLLAAGADLDRVHLLSPSVREPDGTDSLTTLSTDMALIAEACARTGARLLVIDPLMAGLASSTDSHRDQDIRRALAPYSQLAERLDMAIVVVTHTTKSRDGDMIRRIGASVGLSGAARSLLVMGADPSDPEGADGTGRVLVSRGNLTGPVPGLAYQVTPTVVEHHGERLDTSRLVLTGESDATAHDLLAPPDQADHDERESAADWLADYLADGAWHEAQEIIDAAKAVDHSRATVYRARKTLGVESAREGDHGRARWRLAVVSPASGAGETTGGETTRDPALGAGSGDALAPAVSHTERETTGGDRGHLHAVPDDPPPRLTGAAGPYDTTGDFS